MTTPGQFDVSKLPRHKVELHIHLDGAVRLQTIWELSQQKGIHLTSTLNELQDICVTKNPSTLENFLKPIAFYLPVIRGDPDAIERIAYEFCEDAAKEQLCYVELRYSPHLLSSTAGCEVSPHSSTVSPSDVVQYVNRGISKGCGAFGVKIRSILTGIRGRVGWMEDVVKLANEFRYQGVVGIDVAGEHQSLTDTTAEEAAAFKLAASMGLHRTVHAGESGPAEQVKFALEELMAERIGHGYHVVDNPELYRECVKSRVHFEACPYSSLMTGSVGGSYSKHPIVRFAEDDANFSINRDDPTLIQKTLRDDYQLLRDFGMTEAHLVKANFNAARSSFLPGDEKRELINHLKLVYGVGSD